MRDLLSYFLRSSISFVESLFQMEVDESELVGGPELDDSERVEKVGDPGHESKAWPAANQKLTNQVSGQESFISFSMEQSVY